MKKASKVLAAAALAVAFGFASCESKTAQNTENAVESATDEVSEAAESAADEVSETAESATTPTDTISVKDEPVKDGVADKTENQ